jgi:hypothetical protein
MPARLIARRVVARSTLSYLSSPALCCALVIVMAAPERAAADDEDATVSSSRVARSIVPELIGGAPVFRICRDQTYALCAVASCYVFDQVAYCKCDIEQGDSISLAFEVDGEDVCEVNARGPANGYMVSTFSLPDAVVEGGPMALYTCAAGESDGAYAQCDGGLCFTSTEAAPSFPGFDEPLAEGEIICSCPIRVADPDAPTFGYQIAGPFPCEADYFQNCGSAATNRRTGTTIPVGAPTAVPQLLTPLLDGPPVPPLNQCHSPGDGG